MKFLRWLAIIAAIPFALWATIQIRYFPVSERLVSDHGNIEYREHSIDLFDCEQFVDECRNNSRGTIQRAIVYKDVFYCFTKKKKVVAVGLNGYGAPITVLKEWEWNGEPDDFPWYGTVKAPVITYGP